jgi:phosphoglycerol transferase MdoB-like AlkP superfamily enzyme
MIKKLKPSRRIILTISIVVFLILIYTVIRFGFLFANYTKFISFTYSDLISAFLNGLRFDLSAIFWVNIIPLVLLNIPGKIFRNRIYEKTIFILIIFVNVITIVLSVSDYGYYAVTERRLSYEVYFMIKDIINILPGLIVTHYVLVLILISFSIVVIISSLFLLKKFDQKIKNTSGILSEFVYLVLLVVSSIISIRGGLQMKPLRQANAFPNNNLELGYLTLNTPYTVIRSIFQDTIKEIDKLDQKEAVSILRNLLNNPEEKFINDQYPFLRTFSTDSLAQKKNVVIFIMESWSALFCGSITGGKTFTPFFDSLANHSMLFTNFFANGQRSIESLASISVSIPSLFDFSIIGSKAELNRIKGFGSILKEQGYTTSFHHGALTGSMGFDGFSKLAGFDFYFGKEDVKNLTPDDEDGMWGVCDEPFFIETVNNVSNFKEPFCSVIFSLSSHDPFRIPDKRKSEFTQYQNESELERSVRYSDFSLKKFFEYAQSKSWFKNTIFIITADHTLYNSRTNFKTTFHIPCLIYSPENLGTFKSNKTASHMDLVPTLIDFLHLQTTHASMGKSIFLNSDGFAVFKFGAEYIILTDQYCLTNDLENPIKLYEIITDKDLNDDVSKKLPDITNDLNKKLLAYLQTVTYSVAKDKIYSEN